MLTLAWIKGVHFSRQDSILSWTLWSILMDHLIYRNLLCASFPALLKGHQSSVRTTERQLNPERRGKQNVNFPAFNFLQIARGDFGAFSQFLLRPALAHPLAAHVGPEGFDSLPFFFGDGHGILHRLSA